jgi:KaiC/GvpD/RAD55 family RecA-like ATPase
MKMAATAMMTEKEKSDFSHYGTKFQEGLVQLILDDRVFADQIIEVFDYDFLELSYLRSFVKLVFGYREKYGVHPTRDTMLTIVRAELESENEVSQKQIRDFFSRLSASPEDFTTAPYIKDTSLEFCRKQNVKKAMIKCVDLVKTASFDEIAKTMTESINLGSSNEFGYDYIVDFEKRFELKARDPVTTGWQALDSISHGGLGKGELGVCIAPTGAGKSMALVHLGVQGLLSGKTVVHYTLELADTVVATRYDSCITGIPLSSVLANKEKVFDRIQEIEGKLIVKEYPTKSANTSTLKAHLERLVRRGHDIGMVIVDYGDLLKPVSTQREKRNELESIYEELRAIAQIYSCPVWTASQTNRSGLNAEVITMESISEAFNKCFVADFIFSISRTVEDKNTNSGRIFVAKNRNGPDGLVYPIFMDTSNVKIRMSSTTGETIAQASSQIVKNQAQVLKDKYREFKKQEKQKKENN